MQLHFILNRFPQTIPFHSNSYIHILPQLNLPILFYPIHSISYIRIHSISFYFPLLQVYPLHFYSIISTPYPFFTTYIQYICSIGMISIYFYYLSIPFFYKSAYLLYFRTYPSHSILLIHTIFYPFSIHFLSISYCLSIFISKKLIHFLSIFKIYPYPFHS